MSSDELHTAQVLDDTLEGLWDDVDGVARLLAELEEQSDAEAPSSSRNAARLECAVEHMAQAAEELGHLRDRLWRHSVGWHGDPEFFAWGITPEAAVGYQWRVEDLQARCITTADRVVSRIMDDGLDGLCDPAILSLWRPRSRAEPEDRGDDRSTTRGQKTSASHRLDISDQPGPGGKDPEARARVTGGGACR